MLPSSLTSADWITSIADAYSARPSSPRSLHKGTLKSSSASRRGHLLVSIVAGSTFGRVVIYWLFVIERLLICRLDTVLKIDEKHAADWNYIGRRYSSSQRSFQIGRAHV